MTEKIILTQEQADRIEKFKGSKINAIRTHLNKDWNYDLNECVKSIANEDFIKVIWEEDSYRVEPEYKVGDWIVNMKGSIGRIDVVSDKIYEGEWMVEEGNRIVPVLMHCWDDAIKRHATPEEIHTEKERQKWAKAEPGDVILEKFSGKVGILTEKKGGYLEMKREIGETDIRFWNTMHCELYAKREGEGV